ncbi:hypothetical protein [Methylobacterium marchantiae]|uniref:Uncharacterized protein n=1 Tax=Methylobacterium marchantiae TaxID=600331 RepID=A0ABW3WZR4_9HYPH|nr:hypothetical protein AIGOOFII_3144 [Methylobacterium marchantiae]
MIQDMLSLPAMSGTLLAGAAYAALSAFVTGPLVGERTIDKSGWPARCARQVLAEIKADTPPSTRNLDCGAVLGILYGKEGNAFCERHGAVLSLPFGVLGSVQEQQQNAARARAAEQAAVSGSRCDCAVATVLEQRRIDLAVYAGTARLVTPRSVRALDAELVRAARAPICALRG